MCDYIYDYRLKLSDLEKISKNTKNWNVFFSDFEREYVRFDDVGVMMRVFDYIGIPSDVDPDRLHRNVDCLKLTTITYYGKPAWVENNS